MEPERAQGDLSHSAATRSTTPADRINPGQESMMDERTPFELVDVTEKQRPPFEVVDATAKPAQWAAGIGSDDDDLDARAAWERSHEGQRAIAALRRGQVARAIAAARSAARRGASS